MECRVLVVSHSVSGSVHQLAAAVAEGARRAGAEPRHRSLAATSAPSDVRDPVATAEDVLWADGVAFGSPTYFGTVSACLLRFLGSCAGLARGGALAGKLVTGFTTATSPNGGQEATLLGLYRTLLGWGTLIVPTGYTDDSFRAVGGNPYGLSVTSRGGRAVDASALTAARALGERLATLTAALAVRPVTGARPIVI